ncbi:MAG: hypothetical protein ACSHW1_03445 [Yoonia sp.]|uniref:hypothetical protein n=1 Tax=Yoonia sp. TaxID=2212373 RepID=UPI003EF190BC
MTARNTVTFYLHPKLRRRATQGNHNFINKICNVLHGAGLQTAFDSDDDAARLRAMGRSGYSLFLMQGPVNVRGLTMRTTYLYPFWHIEKQPERWDWPVAQASFDPAAVDVQKAANFYRFWRNRLFDEAPIDATRDGFVYLPLQGKLLQHRSFQSCSPIQMVGAVLRHDPMRRVVVTLHPSETYSAAEQAALDQLIKSHDRLALGYHEMAHYLQRCDYVVTQNSGVGLMGYFFAKPLVLFGKSDFHHIALNVGDMSAQAAIAAAPDHDPDYGTYLHWFLQEQAINAGRPEAVKTIARVLRGHGWPV